ncbi:MAG: putative DNA-binding domain-containing protein [Bryobacterales bacterium]|nr:putative DNA-binding domain-containing protein [Bryobacterales bacterium]
MPRDSPPELLGGLQRWMQACILAAGPVGVAIRTREAEREFPASEAPGLIRPSRTLAPLERLDIYRGMYEARLVEALRADYPGLHHRLGDEAFQELCRLYLTEHPSSSYTLNRLGDSLPAFLDRVTGLAKPVFVRDLARFELVSTLVFDEDESPVADPGTIERYAPEVWENLRLRPVRAFRLLRLSYPVHSHMHAFHAGETVPEPRRQRTWLVVYRRTYRVQQLALTAPAFALLGTLSEGATLGEALNAMFEAGGARSEDLQAWFRQWFGEGLFQSVTLV